MTNVACNDFECAYNHQGQCMRVALTLRAMCIGQGKALTCENRIAGDRR